MAIGDLRQLGGALDERGRYGSAFGGSPAREAGLRVAASEVRGSRAASSAPQRRHRRDVGDAVDLGRAVVALERGDHRHGLGVVAAGRSRCRSRGCAATSAASPPRDRGRPARRCARPPPSPARASPKARSRNRAGAARGISRRDPSCATGAMSEWASTRSAGMRWRVKMLRQSAIVAAIWRRGKSG